MPSVYLSSAQADEKLCGRLRDAIARRGDVECSADDHRMGDRAALPPSVVDALSAAAGLVVLATEAGCESPQVRAEVQCVVDAGHSDAIAVVACGLTAEELDARWPELARLGCWILPTDPTDAELDQAAYRALTAARIGPRLPGECVVDFDQIRIEDERVCARVRVDGHIGTFRAPLGPIEAEELRWYLESYHRWPAEAFETRAAGIIDQLPGWGAAMWYALLQAAGPSLGDWLNDTAHDERLLTLRMATPRPVPLDRATAERLIESVGGDAQSRDLILARVAATAEGLHVDDRPPEVLAAHRAENEAQARLLGLPWEMMRHGEQYLFNRDPQVALRRVLVPREPRKPLPERNGPIRVLVVVARPEKAGLIDPRASADALIDAVAPLGEAVKLDFLRPPTVEALSEALSATAYDVLHFDGHGVYDARTGLGCLCFEHRDAEKREAGEAELVDGAALRHALGDKRLPLAFLEACQTAQSEDTSDAAVASALLAAGAESVIAMSHSVLVTAAARFTAAFYAELIAGGSVARATTRARKALAQNVNRGRGENESALKLHDWHVPLLFERAADPVLVPGGTGKHGDRGARERAQRHGTLPDVRETHGHGFVGRLHERLKLERALETKRIALVLGVGGQGKTTLAAELGRWLVRCERFRAAAFVSVEQSPEIEGVLGRIGQALIGPGFVVEGQGEAAIAKAREQIGEWLERHRGLVIIDNFETLLPPPADAPDADVIAQTHRPDLLEGMKDLMRDFAQRGESRVIVTCREPLGRPFRHGRMCEVLTLGGLRERDAVALVAEVCRNEGVRVDPEDDGALKEMVRAAGCHPRSLVLLPAVLRHRGVAAVTDELGELMAELEARHPGERERSLLASVRLSLRRLPARWRDVLPPLGVLRVGVSVPALGLLLEWELAQVNALAAALAERGLVHLELGDNYLRFHPALAAVLADELPAAGAEAAWGRVVAVYGGLVRLLYKLLSGPQQALAVGLTVRELPNLLRALAHLVIPPGDGPDPTDAAIDYATSLEGLLQGTPYRRALAGVAEIRAALAARQGEARWSHARHLAASADIDRLLEAGRLAEALAAAEATVAQAQRAAATGAFAEADYDHAHALFTLGRVREISGQPQAALAAIEQARAGFESLSIDGAARMASVCLTEGADCLRAMGRHAAAAARYEQAIKAQGNLGDARGVAVARGQLATVRLLQGDLAAALSGFHEVRAAFEALDEPATVATAWHQIGLVLQTAERFAEAEDAFKRSVNLKLERGAKLAASSSLDHLGLVARRANRLEEAVTWHRKALTIRIEAGDRVAEARSRNNLAVVLRQLGQLGAAATEARAAAEINEALGVSSEPWKTWNILHNIARDQGDAAQAAAAHGRAIDWYRRYRLQGGMPEPQVMRPFAMVHQAVSQGNGSALADQIDAAIADGELPESDRPTLAALTAFARGQHAAVRAATEALRFDHVVELELLLAGQWPDPTAAKA